MSRTVKGWSDMPGFKSAVNKVKPLLKEEMQRGKTIYPPPKHILRAFKLTSPGAVKVIILGQDPYHGANQANGLAFSVNPGVSLPPSLRNIYKEMEQDIGCKPHDGDLAYLAKQGVLLLNSSLTVEKGKAGSHSKLGWSELVSGVVDYFSDKEVVFILWGAHARGLAFGVKRYVSSPHPSPFSADKGFFGSRPFSKTNRLLKRMGVDPVNWCVRSKRKPNAE